MQIFRFALGWAVGLVGCAALAQDVTAPPAYPDFTFHRVKPPAPGAKKRITVQITAAPAAPRLPAPVALPKAPATSARYDWYWNAISPALADSGPGRLRGAVSALAKGPGGAQVSTPRLQHMRDLADQYGVEILKATVGTKVSPALVLAVIGVESAGQANAVSTAGAAGLMQLMPATADRFGVDDRADPVQNIKGGVAYLEWLMKEFDRDPILVLAGYNAGENAVKDNGGVPPYAETRDYVPKVLAAWTVARGLCLTPPELVSDGCVFALGKAG